MLNGFTMRTSAAARLAVMGALMLALMLPLSMMRSVVGERTVRRDTAAAEIASTWGGAQTLAGVVLAVPYRYSWIDSSGRTQWATANACFLPQVLDVAGTVDPELRRRGLFSVVVYHARLKVSGRFGRPDFTPVRPAADDIKWNEATVNVGIADPRGIVHRMDLVWNGQREPFVPGVADNGLALSGVQATARGLRADENSALPFEVEIELNGTGELRFVPAGDQTSVQLTSSWPHPGFSGAPLPATRRVDATGFAATWHVPYFGRGFPPRWTTAALVNRDELKRQVDGSGFGVSLVQPVDIYQQAERSVKYAALFIVMTFVIAFLWEIMGGVLVHPVQYLFVGFAMSIFYLLLLSLSEHVGFDPAYLAASVMTIGLLAWYWTWVLQGVRRGIAMGGVLAGLYAYLYLLLRLEDYALLAGSIGVFVMLAVVMFLTRRVNWFELRLGD
jgi:inner membrane protein